MLVKPEFCLVRQLRMCCTECHRNIYKHLVQDINLDIHIRVPYLLGCTVCSAHNRRHGEVFLHDSFLAVTEKSVQSRQSDLEVLLNVLQVQKAENT